MDKKRKILVIEDDKSYLKTYQYTFEKGGFDCRVAFDGKEGLEDLEKDVPDLILLDLIMPIKNGFEFLKELRANEKFKDIPVVVLSNIGQDANKKAAKELGVIDYLVKAEWTLITVVERIKKILDKLEREK